MSYDKISNKYDPRSPRKGLRPRGVSPRSPPHSPSTIKSTGSTPLLAPVSFGASAAAAMGSVTSGISKLLARRKSSASTPKTSI